MFRTAANLGPETVPNWSGYIGTGTNHSSQLFYWFFESRGNAATDPIVLWMTGGPGCSGQLALFTENGPYHIMPDMSLTLNPHSWTEAASVIWIDQPVNSGFSYNDPWTAPGVVNEAGVSADMSDFLHTFFNDFSNYTAQPFHIIGERCVAAQCERLGCALALTRHPRARLLSPATRGTTSLRSARACWTTTPAV